MLWAIKKFFVIQVWCSFSSWSIASEFEAFLRLFDSLTWKCGYHLSKQNKYWLSRQQYSVCLTEVYHNWSRFFIHFWNATVSPILFGHFLFCERNTVFAEIISGLFAIYMALWFTERIHLAMSFIQMWINSRFCVIVFGPHAPFRAGRLKKYRYVFSIVWRCFCCFCHHFEPSILTDN